MSIAIIANYTFSSSAQTMAHVSVVCKDFLKVFSLPSELSFLTNARSTRSALEPKLNSFFPPRTYFLWRAEHNDNDNDRTNVQREN